MLHLFFIDNSLFTILGYNMSYIEYSAIMFTLICVIFVAKGSIWNWPMGIIGVSLYGIVFYQYQLYSDMFLQIFFFVANCIGWYKWLTDKDSHNRQINTYWATPSENIKYLIGIIIGIALMGWFMSNINHIFPKLFPHPASFPYADSSIAVLSFAATIWQINKRINQWILWMINDVIAIILYFIKHIPFTSLLYCLFLLIVIKGLFNWIKLHKTNS